VGGPGSGPRRGQRNRAGTGRGGKTKRMSINKINTEFQDMRFGASGQNDVRNIVSAIKKGRRMPPVLVSKSGYLQDGRHRLAAYKQLKKRNVRVVYGYHPAAKVTKKR